jgi:hypothetical protein
MSIYDKSSLVLIPSGTKAGKVYSQKPVSGDGDFTFTRASAATRVNADGNIEKETGNLLLQSNQFNTTWNSYNLSRTAGANDFDGGTNAWTIAKLGSYGLINQYITNTGVHTFSIYVKAGSLDWVALTTSQAPYSAAYFDLANGVVGSLVNAIDSNIESIGGGWYRCSLTSNVTAAGNWRIYPADSDGGLSNANLGNIIIYKSQLEQGLVARTYIDTTTAPVYEGITDNLPRLDYSGGASCPALLLEPQRTNLFTQSEYFSAWSTIQNATITDNDLSSPEGLQNAAKITDNATSGNHRIFQSVTTTAASYTFSIFLKKGTMTTAFLFFNSGGTAASANVDLDAGTITATAGSATIEDYGSDWYRCSITGTAVAGTSYLYVYMKQLSGYSGSGQDMYLYGAQIELGSYATSYIPTMGVSATRAKDSINQNIQSITNGWTEGTLFIEFVKPNTGENNDVMRLRGSGNLGRAYIYNYGVGFASDWGTSQNFTIGENTKAAWRLNSLSDGVEFLNGNKGVGASGTAWSDIRQFRFNEDGAGGVLHIKQILLFPTALTDAECITLTTL